MLQYWNFNTRKRTFGRFGWALLEGRRFTQAAATAWQVNSTFQWKRQLCAGPIINVRDLTSRIEAAYCRFTMVRKKLASHHVFHSKTAGTVRIWPRYAWSPTRTFYRLYAVNARCVYTPLLDWFQLPLHFFSNDYMPTCQGLIDFVRIEPTDANLSRNKYSS